MFLFILFVSFIDVSTLGYLVIWLSGYLVIWLSGYLVIWLSGLVIWMVEMPKSPINNIIIF
jgi:hypothetical protein